MRRIMLTVAYDGTAYHGWAIQPGAVTIEETLNNVITELVGENVEVIGASRTDAGVHALGNVAVFDTQSKIPGEKFAYALNARLPKDIRVVSSKEVSLDFHPRKCEAQKTYQYRIYTGAIENPLKRLYTHHVYTPINIEEMQKACAYFLGEHDFTSLCSVNAQALTRVRTIYELTVCKIDDEIIIEVSGNGFLYNMVRIIAGTLLEVGAGRRKAQDMEEMISGCDRTLAGPTAPAKGLTLIGYEYFQKDRKNPVDTGKTL